MIDTSDAENPVDQDLEAADAGISGRTLVGRVLIGAIAIGSFAIWGYAYSGLATPDREYTDQLDVTAYPESAEPICAAAMASLSTLPYSIAAADADERANQINAADQILAAMVIDLRAISLTPQTERDQGMINQWLDEYDIYVADRERYAAKLRVDPLAVMTFTDIGTGRIERRLTWFADVNQMDSCITPTDVG